MFNEINVEEETTIKQWVREVSESKWHFKTKLLEHYPMKRSVFETSLPANTLACYKDLMQKGGYIMYPIANINYKKALEEVKRNEFKNVVFLLYGKPVPGEPHILYGF